MEQDMVKRFAPRTRGLDKDLQIILRMGLADKIIKPFRTQRHIHIFRAAFAVALTEGRGVKDCLSFAARASALCVGRMGAMPSMPQRAEV